jgi:hypothetical protein
VTVTVDGDQPLVIKVQGTATIAGTLDLSGHDGISGVTSIQAGIGGLGTAGGGNGSDGTFAMNTGEVPAGPGFGPGAGGGGQHWSGGAGAGFSIMGQSTIGTNLGSGAPGGFPYGSPDLVPAFAGSGGGGGSGGYNCGSGGGGGGGGLLKLIAGGDVFIAPSGAIVARGGNGGSDGMGNCGSGGGGSGGSIWVRSLVQVKADGVIIATGGVGGATSLTPYDQYGSLGGTGAPGRVRLDGAVVSIGGPVDPPPGFTGGPWM